ncbi:MAG: hypothetical protein HY791_09245 [Deltaproteobacteria bacterium]|nr:hypothetical protein [Deltaproteobacteria bacterium]
MRWLIFAVLVSPGCSCSEEPGPGARRVFAPFDAGGALDAGHFDAAEGDSPDSGATDLGRGDGSTRDGGGRRDCALGLADGCCPLSRRYGGSDPDCPVLACPTLSGSDPIELLDPQTRGTDFWSTPALAFDGQELEIAIADARYRPPAESAGVLVQRRSLSGDLTREIERKDLTSGRRLIHGPTRLIVEPTSRRSVFVAPATQPSEFVALSWVDESGVSAESRLGTICNGFANHLDLVLRGDGFRAVQSYENCESTTLGVAICDLAADGSLLGTHQEPARTQYLAASAFDFDSARSLLLIVKNDGQPRDRLEASWYGDALVPLGLVSTIEHSAGDYDTVSIGRGAGQFGVLRETRRFVQFQGLRKRLEFLTLSDSGEVGTPVELIPYDHDLNLAEAKIMWTGRDYLLVLTTLAGAESLGPSFSDEPSAEVIRVAESGQILDRFALDPDPGSIQEVFVDAVWAGDRFAISWVGVKGDGSRRPYLRFVGCGE